MTVSRWTELTRTTLREVLPEALVVLPIGATEQHGPHLPTGTDALLVQTVVEQGADRAATTCPRPIVLAPTIPVGASDHHLPFGGTLSLAPETVHALLLDVARSVVTCGGRRLVVVNGHGGNHGIVHAAGAAASNRYEIAVATTDYWRLLPAADPTAERMSAAGAAVPGHAGEFETALVRAVRPDLVAAPSAAHGTSRTPMSVSGFDVHAKASWAGMDGFTDDPGRARPEDGAALLRALAAALADRFVELAKTL